MAFQNEPNVIRWRLHLTSSPATVHAALATDDGRARFWAESAVETNGEIHFRFPNGLTWRGRVIENRSPHRFAVRYFGGSRVTFELGDDGVGGTDLTLTDVGAS